MTPQRTPNPGPARAAGLLLAAALALPAGAASRRLAGDVVDASGAALAGATVVLRRADTGFERLTQADESGRFVFDGLTPGRYGLSARARGFAPAEQALDVPPEAPPRLTLAPAPVVEQVTVVSGSRQAELRHSLNTDVEVLTRERLADSGAATVGEALRDLPGVVTRRGSESAGAAGEQVQGLDSRQVLVLLDGQPLLGARGIKRGVLNLDRQPLGRLERVEVVKGASSSLYGSDAIGGVINLVTREATRPLQGALSLAGGSQGAFDARAEGGFARGAWRGFVSLERHGHDGFDLFPTTPDTTGAPFRRGDLYAKLTFAPSERVTLTASGNGYSNRSRAVVVGESGLQTSDVKDDARNWGLTGEWRPSPRTSVQARAYLGRYDETGDNALLGAGSSALPRDELRERLAKLDLTFTRVAGERQLLQAGVEWWRDEYAGVNRLRRDEGERARTRVAWVQDRVSLPGRVTLTVGARFDDHDVFGSAFSPKAALNWRAASGLSLRASYGRGFRAPDLGQLYYRFLNPTNFYQVIGNPALDPERARSWQLGGEWSARDGRARLGLNAFRNDVRDLVDSVSLGFVASPAQLAAIAAREGLDPEFRPTLNRLLFFHQNVADARTQGFEADGEARLFAGLSLAGAYTRLDAHDRATGLPLLNRHRHHGSARLAWAGARTGTRVDLRAAAFSSWLVSRAVSAAGTSETRADGFTLLDLFVSQRLRAGLEVFAAIDNLADSRDANAGELDAAGRPLPVYRADVGRAWRAGLRWSGER